MAYRRFHEHVWKTDTLLNVGLSGLSGKVEQFDEILKKFDPVKLPRGRLPKSFEPDVEAKPLPQGGLQLSMDDRTAAFLFKVVDSARDKHSKLRFHLYSILAVSLWGAFETYLAMLFGELFEKRPELLKSNEQLTFKEAVEHNANLLGFLTQRQLEKIGHLKLKDLSDYLAGRIGFKLTSSDVAKLDPLYVVRNVVAHNSGIVRSDADKRIPPTLGIQNGELRVTKPFVHEMALKIERVVTRIERHVGRKFYDS